MCVFDSKTNTWANWSQNDPQTNHKLKSPATILKNKELLHQKFRDLVGVRFSCLFFKLRRSSPAVPSRYVTQMQNYFSHPSLLFSFFPTPPTKLKLGLGILCTAAGYTLQFLTYYHNPSQSPMEQHTEIHTKGRWGEQASTGTQADKPDGRASTHTLFFSLARAREYMRENFEKEAQIVSQQVFCFREASIRRYAVFYKARRTSVGCKGENWKGNRRQNKYPISTLSL